MKTIILILVCLSLACAASHVSDGAINEESIVAATIDSVNIVWPRADSVTVINYGNKQVYILVIFPGEDGLSVAEREWLRKVANDVNDLKAAFPHMPYYYDFQGAAKRAAEETDSLFRDTPFLKRYRDGVGGQP